MCCAFAAVATGTPDRSENASAALRQVIDTAFGASRLKASNLDEIRKRKDMLKKTIAAAAAFSLAASPVLAQSRTIPVEPASEEVEGSEFRGRGTLLPALAVIAIILAILALTDTWPFDEDPESP
jgi:hypothetical protein